MLTTLFYISIITGGLLVLLMLISLISGIDLEIDLGDTSADADSSSGGIGLLKGFLTFLSVASYVTRYFILTEQNTFIAGLIGIFSGIVAFLILNYLFRYLLKNEENVNWNMEDAVYAEGDVYLKIPGKGQGIAKVLIKGSYKELKATSYDGSTLPTGSKIIVMEVHDNSVAVSKLEK